MPEGPVSTHTRTPANLPLVAGATEIEHHRVPGGLLDAVRQVWKLRGGTSGDLWTPEIMLLIALSASPIGLLQDEITLALDSSRRTVRTAENRLESKGLVVREVDSHTGKTSFRLTDKGLNFVDDVSEVLVAARQPPPGRTSSWPWSEKNVAAAPKSLILSAIDEAENAARELRELASDALPPISIQEFDDLPPTTTITEFGQIAELTPAMLTRVIDAMGGAGANIGPSTNLGSLSVGLRRRLFLHYSEIRTITIGSEVLYNLRRRMIDFFDTTIGPDESRRASPALADSRRDDEIVYALPESLDDCLNEIQRLTLEIKKAESTRELIVERAKALGVSYTKLGKAALLTTSQAGERWNPAVKERRKLARQRRAQQLQDNND